MTDQIIDTIFGATFVGNTVFITSNVSQTQRINLPEGIMTETLPMFFEGVLMDIDDEYLYLGNGKKVSNAIKREFILQIELKEDNKYTELLKSVNPQDENDIN